MTSQGPQLQRDGTRPGTNAIEGFAHDGAPGIVKTPSWYAGAYDYYDRCDYGSFRTTVSVSYGERLIAAGSHAYPG